MRFVRVATLDDPEALPPDVHIFAGSKVSWVSLAPEAQVFDVYYDMAKLWPAESLARRRTILGAG
jgi:hypothetical protein